MTANARTPARRKFRLTALVVLLAGLIAACGTTATESEGTAGTFRVAADREAVTAARGAGVDVSLRIYATPGLEGGVRLSVEGLPEGVTANFDPNPASERSRLLLEVGEDAPTGTHELSVRAVADNATRQATLALTLEAHDADADPDGDGEKAEGDGDENGGEEEPDTEPIPHHEAPPAPSGFEFFQPDPTRAEGHLSMRWRSSPQAEDYTVYRRIEPLALPSSGPARLQAQDLDYGPPVKPVPSAWHEITTRQRFGEWDEWLDATDSSVPVPDERPLGGVYCYKVEAHNAIGSTDSSEICTRLSRIDAPSVRPYDARPSNTAPTTAMYVEWNDGSAYADGFHIYLDSKRIKSVPTDPEKKLQPGSPRYVTTVHGLQPDTTYCFTVTAYDYYGESQDDGPACGRTFPDTDSEEPDPEDAESAITVNLQYESVVEGNIAYKGRLPTLGPGDGKITAVESPAGWAPTLSFVKPGKSTEDCNDADAVVVLEPGTGLTASQMEDAFGSASPSLPVHFLACTGPQNPSTPPYDWLPIAVTYTGHL